MLHALRKKIASLIAPRPSSLEQVGVVLAALAPAIAFIAGGYTADALRPGKGPTNERDIALALDRLRQERRSDRRITSIRIGVDKILADDGEGK